MQTHCPECGDPYAEPQPDDYACGACGMRLALQAIARIPKPIVYLSHSSFAELCEKLANENPETQET